MSSFCILKYEHMTLDISMFNNTSPLHIKTQTCPNVGFGKPTYTLVPCWMDKPLPPRNQHRTRLANSALKCRIINSITARSLCSYNNILINFGHLYRNTCYTTSSIANFGHVYSMWISSTLGSEALYLSHISAPHKMTYFLPNWPCRYGIHVAPP